MTEEIKHILERTKSRDSYKQMLEGLDIEAFEAHLAELSLNDALRLATNIGKAFEGCDIPDAFRPVAEAVHRDLKRRNEAMKQKEEEQNRLIAELNQKMKEQDRRYRDLQHEKHRLKMQVALRGLQYREQEATGSFKVGRNDPCPCSSGKKYKNCCWK